MSPRAGRNAAHCPGWPLQPQRCFASRWRGTRLRHAVDPGDLCQPSGPDGEGQARGQARNARGESPQCGAAQPMLDRTGHINLSSFIVAIIVSLMLVRSLHECLAAPEWRRSLFKWLQTIPIPLLKGTAAAFIAGFILFALGVWGDSSGWWTNRPYLTNLISGLTGACFGIPLALVVFNNITEAISMRAERQALLRLAAVSCSNLSQAISAGYGDILTWVTSIHWIHEASKSIPFGRPGAVMRESGNDEDYSRDIRRWWNGIGRFCDNYLSRGAPSLEVKNWSQIAAEWQAVKSLSPRLHELGCFWITSVQEYEFDLAVNNPSSIRNLEVERLSYELEDIGDDNFRLHDTVELGRTARQISDWGEEILNHTRRH